jgi:GNAT superfamily N-acetyltransferase
MMSSKTDEAIAILVDGFFDDPVLAWIFEDEATRARAIASWYRFWLDLYGEHGTLTTAADGAGAILWADPGAPRLDAETVAPLLELVREYNGDRTGFVFGGLSAIAPPAETHYYVNAIAARRGQRGRGVGARLFEPFLARADLEGVPAYLESSNPQNLSFYGRHGFEAHGARIDMPEDGPVLQPMWRAVAGAGAGAKAG